MSVPRLRNYEGRTPSCYTFRVLPAGLDLFRRGDPTVAGRIRGRPCPPTSFAPRYWHVDEMLLGYVATILGGFSAYGGSELDRAASAAGHAARALLHLARWTERGRLNVVDR